MPDLDLTMYWRERDADIMKLIIMRLCAQHPKLDLWKTYESIMKRTKPFVFDLSQSTTYFELTFTRSTPSKKHVYSVKVDHAQLLALNLLADVLNLKYKDTTCQKVKSQPGVDIARLSQSRHSKA